MVVPDKPSLIPKLSLHFLLNLRMERQRALGVRLDKESTCCESINLHECPDCLLQSLTHVNQLDTRLDHTLHILASLSAAD